MYLLLFLLQQYHHLLVAIQLPLGDICHPLGDILLDMLHHHRTAQRHLILVIARGVICFAA